MNYAIGLGGLGGTYLMAYVIFSRYGIYPVWKRWALGCVALALIVTFWTVQPVFPWLIGTSFDDCWDVRTNVCT